MARKADYRDYYGMLTYSDFLRLEELGELEEYAISQ